MSKIKIAELFYSIQGEGRYMGVPSVFLRTFGCNFKCAGFGMPQGELSMEAAGIAATHSLVTPFQTYNALPLVSTGCDSYASWMPEFKDLSRMLTSDAIADAIVDALPYKEWRDEHLVITGGEPLLGWQKAYPDLLEHTKMRSLKELTFETNGTQFITNEFNEYIFQEWTRFGRDYGNITFSVSPKLSISGEKWEDAIRPEVILQYQLLGNTYLKFVVATKEDAEEAEQAVNEYRKFGFGGVVYIMPCGGTEEMYSLNNRGVAELAMKKGWRYSDRLQIPLFKNAWGT